MKILENYPLLKHNTLGINANTKYFCFISDIEDLLKLVNSEIYKNEKRFVIGSGSNVLFKGDFEGLIIHLDNKRISITLEDDDNVLVKADGGVIWDDLVKWTVEKGYCGLENLSLIPGTVGASPVQNIGAYGTELKDSFYEAEIFNSLTNQIEVFDNSKCAFGYRDSIFKNQLKHHSIVLNVTFKLSKKLTLNLSYKELCNRFSDDPKPTLEKIRKTVIDIRTEKLPDPTIMPNAGSFFKNPIVSINRYESLKLIHKTLIGYNVEEGYIKLAAGQLIELCGWKDLQEGKIAVHPRQALVIINKDNASGDEIVEFASKISRSVMDKFGVLIEPEVNFV